VRSGAVRSGAVRSGAVRSGAVRSGRARSRVSAGAERVVGDAHLVANGMLMVGIWRARGGEIASVWFFFTHELHTNAIFMEYYT